MDTQEKTQAILEAVNSKKVSANQIDPSRKGSTITEIKKGKKVSPSTVDKLYDSMLAILSRSEPANQKQKQEQKKEYVRQEKTHTQENDSLSAMAARIAKLEKENLELKAMFTDLVSRVASLTQKETNIQTNAQMLMIESILSRLETIETAQTNIQIEQTEQMPAQNETRILGFKIVKKNTSSRLADGSVKKYEKWYAVKQGKTIYLGDSPDNAETKIETYCLKHGLNKATQERQLEIFP